eukprot:COSAG06_NODE_38076_length_427_cov_3.152439_1_plen_85_part_10
MVVVALRNRLGAAIAKDWLVAAGLAADRHNTDARTRVARKARSAPTRRPRSPIAYVVALLTQPSLSSLPYPIVAAIRALIDGKSH